MQDFLHMVTRMHEENFSRVKEVLRESQAPCGYFYPYTNILDDTIPGLAQLEDAGLNITVIYTFGEEFAKKAAEKHQRKIVGLPSFFENPSQISAMLVHHLHWQGALGPLFEEKGVPTFFLDSLPRAASCSNYYMQHLNVLYDAYADFHDADSRQAFLGGMLGRVTCRWADFHFAPEPQYFLAGCMPSEGDIVIDGGAYDGGTSAAFASLGTKVYAFEMDRANYEKCRARAAESGFVIENMGLSDHSKVEHYQAIDTASHIDANGNDKAQFISIDEYVEQKGLPRVDYIKLDVEGAEYDTLRGAVKTIAKWKPRMAISAYHLLDDIWKLQQYVKSIRPDYTFTFRHYKIDVHDYWLNDADRTNLRNFELGELIPTECEMVLYAH